MSAWHTFIILHGIAACGISELTFFVVFWTKPGKTEAVLPFEDVGYVSIVEAKCLTWYRKRVKQTKQENFIVDRHCLFYFYHVNAMNLNEYKRLSSCISFFLSRMPWTKWFSYLLYACFISCYLIVFRRHGVYRHTSDILRRKKNREKRTRFIVSHFKNKWSHKQAAGREKNFVVWNGITETHGRNQN